MAENVLERDRKVLQLCEMLRNGVTVWVCLVEIQTREIKEDGLHISVTCV